MAFENLVLVCGTVRGYSEGVALLGEGCHAGQALRFQKPHTIPSLFFLLSVCGSRWEP